MKKRILVSICLLQAIVFSSLSPVNSIQKKILKQASKVFDNKNLILKKAFESDVDGFDSNRFFVLADDDLAIGYAYFGEAPSKTDTFEYLVLFDTDLIIKNTKVVTYREDYGGEIGSKRWLKQFLGKSTLDRFIYNDNIASISGATISVKSMTYAMNDLMSTLDKVKQLD